MRTYCLALMGLTVFERENTDSVLLTDIYALAHNLGLSVSCQGGDLCIGDRRFSLSQLQEITYKRQLMNVMMEEIGDRII